jgi:16S rRNA G966 N2-methylase RsmD
MKDPINPARVTPTSAFHVTGVQPEAEPLAHRMLHNRIERLKAFVELDPPCPRQLVEAEIRLIDLARLKWLEREQAVALALDQALAALSNTTQSRHRNAALIDQIAKLRRGGWDEMPQWKCGSEGGKRGPG